MMIALACIALLAYLVSACLVPTGPVVGATSGPRAASLVAVASANDAGAMLERIARAADAATDGLCGALFADELQAAASADRVRYALARIPMPHAFRVDLSGRVLA